MTAQQDIAIQAEHLMKRYNKARNNAVDDVSFSIRRGEIFGLLGPNGAGKTTTIGVLTTSTVPTSGSVQIMGIDVTADPIGVKQHISVVPQRSNLDQSLRVREILTFHASYHGVPRSVRDARADALLAEFGLAERSKDVIRTYSGGMTQRVMLARALMHTPTVLFLDEPTTNLDPQSRLYLWERIRALQKQGITILLTTHDMEEADHLCEHIAIMDHGRILVLDTPAELKKLIPGGSTLELRIRLPEQALNRAMLHSQEASEDPFLHTLTTLPGIMKAEEVFSSADDTQPDLRIFRIYAEDVAGLISETMQAIIASGGELQDLSIAKPSLEDVFIYLTGRNLRS